MKATTKTTSTKKATTTTKAKASKSTSKTCTVKLIAETFPKVEYLSLSNKDKKIVAILKKLSRESKESKIKIPLSSSIDVESAKTFSVDLESLVRVQYAILKECSLVFTYEEKKDTNGENFRVYFLLKKKGFNLPSSVIREAKVKEVKRPSSAKTKAKAKTKKEEEITSKAIEAKESADNNQWNKNASMAIVDHLIGKYHIDCPNRVDLEKEIIAILEKVR